MTTARGVSLRRAIAADAPMVAPFHLRCWQEAYADLVPRDFLDQMAGQDRAQRWHDRLMRHADTSILAFIGDALVGLATVGPSGDAAPLPSTELRSMRWPSRGAPLPAGTRDETPP